MSNHGKILRQYAEMRIRHADVSDQVRASARSRLVWFVAIAGFVVLNLTLFWGRLVTAEMTGVQFLAMVAPWGVVISLALATHYVMDEVWLRDRNASDTAWAVAQRLANGAEAGEDVEAEASQLFKNEHPLVEPLSNKVERWGDWANRMERATLLLVFVSFTWLIVGPFVLA